MYLNDTNRVAELLNSVELFKRATKNTKATIKYFLNEPIKDAGVIRINAENVNIVNSDLFLKAVEKSSNWEVMPLLNGTIDISILFFGVLLEEINDE